MSRVNFKSHSLDYSLNTKFSSIVSAAQRQEQCSGLEDLARNVNPVFLANCVQESDCTKVTCQTREDLRNFFTAILFTPLPCLPRPGVRIQALDRGNVIYEEIFIYRDGGINATRSQFSTLSLQVSVESTARSIELTVRRHPLIFTVYNYYCQLRVD